MLEKITVDFEESHEVFTAFLDGEKVGDLEIYRDEDDKEYRPWLNKIGVNEDMRNRGIGKKLVQAAVDQFGSVYASRAPKGMHNDQMGDTRWLSIDGARLVESCVKKGIMKPEWFINPFGEDRDYDDEPED